MAKGVFLSSSADWTVSLWTTDRFQPCITFASRKVFISILINLIDQWIFSETSIRYLLVTKIGNNVLLCQWGSRWSLGFIKKYVRNSLNLFDWYSFLFFNRLEPINVILATQQYIFTSLIYAPNSDVYFFGYLILHNKFFFFSVRSRRYEYWFCDGISFEKSSNTNNCMLSGFFFFSIQ